MQCDGFALRLLNIFPADVSGLLGAVGVSGAQLGGLVEYRVGGQVACPAADVWRGVVGQHHHLLARLTVAGPCKHAQAAALLEKQIHDGQVPTAVL